MSNLIKVSKISKRLKDIYIFIDIGTVTSIFNRVINIATDKGLVAIQEPSIPFTPFSIQLNDSTLVRNFKFQLNERICFTEGAIRFNKFIFNLNGVEVVDTKLEEAYDFISFRSKIDWLIRILSDLLRFNSILTENHIGLLDFITHIEIINNRITVDDRHAKTNLLNYLHHKFHYADTLSNQFMVEMTSFVGLGDGLTPSFDDFLVGLLSCLQFAGKGEKGIKSRRSIVIDSVESNLNNTTSVSAEFLYSAILNDFSEPLLIFYKSINQFDKNKIKQSLEEILKIGHSSGVDTINGILFGLKLIKDIVSVR